MKATSFPHGSFVFTCVHPFLRPTSWRDIGVCLKIRFPKIKWFTMVYSHPLDIDNLALFSSIEIQRFFSSYNPMPKLQSSLAFKNCQVFSSLALCVWIPLDSFTAIIRPAGCLACFKWFDGRDRIAHHVTILEILSPRRSYHVDPT